MISLYCFTSVGSKVELAGKQVPMKINVPLPLLLCIPSFGFLQTRSYAFSCTQRLTYEHDEGLTIYLLRLFV